MSSQLVETDLLPHIEASAETAQTNLVSLATTTNGCLEILSAFGCSVDVCYELHGDSVTINAKLKTPAGNVSLGSATLSADHTSATIGGSIAGFKAELTVEFNFDDLVLTLKGTLCAPLVGCKHGQVCVHV